MALIELPLFLLTLIAILKHILLQKQQQLAEEAAKAAAAREYAAKKGIVVDEEAAPACMSGIPERPFCKGRNYNPNRYGKHTEE